MIQFVKSIEMVPAFKSDHSIVRLVLDFHPFKRGPGYCRLNTSLLKKQDFVEKMNMLFDIEWENSSNLKSFSDRWELLKLAFKGSSIQYSSRVKKSNIQKIKVLERKFKQYEDKEISQGNHILADNTEQIRLKRHDIVMSNSEMTLAAKIRNSSRWAMAAEKPTKYFLGLQKSN